MASQQTNEEKTLVAIFILHCLLLLIVPLLRWYTGNPLIPLDHAYAYVSYFQNPILLLCIFGILAIVNFFLLVKVLQHLVEPLKQNIILGLFAIAPLIITLHTSASLATILLTLVLACCLLYVQKRYELATLILFVGFFIDVLSTVVLITLLCIHLVFQKQKRYVLPALAAWILTFSIGFILPKRTEVFAEFGGLFGISIFVLILSAVSILFAWKRINIVYALMWVGLFILCLFLVPLRAIVLLPMLFYVADVLEFLWQKTWSILILKRASFLLLVCLALFVVLTHTQALVLSEPSAALVDTVASADADYREGGILVLNSHRNALTYLSNREVIGLNPEDPFYQSARLSSASAILTQNEIRFIIITDEMRKGLVWDRSAQGLLLPLENNEKFIKVRDSEGIELWLVLSEFVTSGEGI